MEFYHIVYSLILVLFAFFVAKKSLRNGFYLYLISVPFMHKELFSVGVWDLLPIRLFALGVIINVLHRSIIWFIRTEPKIRRDKIKSYLLYDYFLILLLLLWFVRCFSILINGWDLGNLSLLAFFTSIVFTYMIFKYLLTKYGKEFYELVIKIYLIIGALSVLFSGLQYILRACCKYSIGGIWVIPGFQPRLGSLFWDVNHFGGFLITLIPISIGLFFAVKSRFNKTLLTVYVLLIGLSLFMTQSRSSMVGLAIGILTSIFLYYGNKLKKPLIFGIVLSIIGVLGLIGYTTFKDLSIRDKIASYMHFRLDSSDTHLMLIEGSAEVFLNSQIIGAGYGNFDESFRLTETAKDYFDREPALRNMKVPSHSIWGEIIAETGGLGIVVYLLFTLLVISSLITAISKTDNIKYKYLGIGLFGGLFSIFIAGIFYSYNLEFYWIMVFISIGYISLKLRVDNKLALVIKDWIKRPITPYLLIIPPTLFFIFIMLGRNTLIDWDEAIYAKVAKNIVMNNEWLSLRWINKDNYWFEKPPLYMWFSAISFKIFGINAFGARLTSAVFGVLGILFTYKLSKKLYTKTTGIISAFILLTTVGYIYYSRNGMLDVTVSFFILGSLYYFYKSINEKTRELNTLQDKNINKKGNSIFFAVSGIFVGLAIMTKAVVGLLPFIIILAYTLKLLIFRKKYYDLCVRDYQLWFVSILIVILPWHLYSYLLHGDKFFHVYFFDQVLGRGTEGLGHEQPALWYLEVIKVSMRLWVFPLIASLVLIPIIDKKHLNKMSFLMMTSLIIFLVFSTSKDKLQWYIIPIYPYLSVLSARGIELMIKKIQLIKFKNKSLDQAILRSIFIFIFSIFSIFYIINIRNKIYFGDPNKNKIAMIKIHNELYPIKEGKERPLYYSKYITPSIWFYSDHDVIEISEDGILEKIQDAGPNQSYSFLVSEEIYYDMRKRQNDIEAPISFSNKGSAGGWMLIQSRSRVEVLRNRLEKALKEYSELPGSTKEILNRDNDQKRKDLLTEIKSIVDQLTEYGYPPKLPKNANVII